MQKLSTPTPYAHPAYGPKKHKEGNARDGAYRDYLGRLNKRYADLTASETVFETDAAGLYEAYLSGFPETTRQYHDCHACRRFIERYGHLVVIDTWGTTASPLWSYKDAERGSEAAIGAMAQRVALANVTGPFYSSHRVWGETGPCWQHFHIANPNVYAGVLVTPAQAAAEKREDYKNVRRALAEFSPQLLDQAITILRGEALYRSEKVLDPIVWLRSLHELRSKAGARDRKDNVLWRAVAKAPSSSFCHPRSSMAGSLLEDLKAELTFTEVAQRFAAKMHPLQYQRPQAAPSRGTIDQAETIVAKLGIARSLARRFARLHEIQALWRPMQPTSEERGGVFAHLRAKESQQLAHMDMPPIVMTWEKFQRTVLPTADKIAFYTPNVRMSFCAFTTAVDHEAPPILQWDCPALREPRAHMRNPVSWYYWSGGATPEQFGLLPNTYHSVNAVALQPSMWNGGSEHHGAGVMFVLDGARETRDGGSGLFPECLRSELHSVRSVIEAYSKDGRVEGKELGDACGVMVSKSSQVWTVPLRVWTGGTVLNYRLDRWD